MMRDEFTKLFNEQYPVHAPLHLSDRDVIIEAIKFYCEHRETEISMEA